MEENDPSIMDAVMVIGLIKEASLRHTLDSVNDKQSTLINYNEFVNDAINDTSSGVDLDADFEKWYKDRKRHNSHRKRTSSGSSSTLSSSSATSATTTLSFTTTTSNSSTTTSSFSSATKTGGETKNDIQREDDPLTVWQKPQNLKRENFSFCACNYVLDTASKAKMLRYDAHFEQMHIVNDTARRQHGFMTQNDVYLILNIDRNNLVSSTMNQIGYLSRLDLRKPLKIKFKGEEGVDEGGVKKEFFQVMLRQLFDPEYDLVYSMFSYVESTRLFYFSPDTLEPPVSVHIVFTIFTQFLLNCYSIFTQF
jgi:hypothetical protein